MMNGVLLAAIWGKLARRSQDRGVIVYIEHNFIKPSLLAKL